MKNNDYLRALFRSYGSKTITITGSFVVDTDYYVAILPGEHQFTVKIDGFLSKASTKTSSVDRAKLMNMKKLPLDLIYLVPNSNWKQASARFAVYNFKDDKTSKWVDLKPYNGHYACERSTLEYSNVIFCRMNPANKTNNWNNRWNQTGDMTLGTQAYCVIPELLWDGSKVWSDDTTLPFIKDDNFYLVPNSDWNQSNARFAAYFCNGTSPAKWISMTAVSVAPGYYEVAKPTNENHKNIIFVRMNPANNNNDWGNKWNQTSDLGFTSGNVYEITGWDTGKWHTVK